MQHALCVSSLKLNIVFFPVTVLSVKPACNNANGLIDSFVSVDSEIIKLGNQMSILPDF